ncbi:MAG TPA: hypothetical protein VF277_06950, partial [Steroidobacteraceae bacterium]
LLVIRLDIDAATAHARKPDHELGMLREKAAIWPRLAFGDAPILELDGRESADAVFEQALRAANAACDSALEGAVAAPALPQPVAGLVAVVGCDGTGKSTLTHDLVDRLSRTRPTQRRYLGLVSGEAGERIRRLPLIGPRLERRLAAKAERAQNMRNRPPGIWAALIMYGFSLWRAAHLRRARRLAEQGVLVITDRYPQAEIAGFHYDGPGLGLERSKSARVRRLAAREQRLYERLTLRPPALVIRLGIDLATAQARKPDHAAAELRDKIAVMARLRFGGARIMELDTRAPYAQVLQEALEAIITTTSHPAGVAPDSLPNAAVPAQGAAPLETSTRN